ncbi:MAG: SCO family protein [Rhizobiales bacterium]|nr:SCO family protein [Hyphomicrobiales bacterium]
MSRLVVLLAFVVAFLGLQTLGAPAQIRLEGTDHLGRAVTAQEPGGWRLVMFGYTRCPDVCPLGLQTLTETMDALGPLGERFTPVFVTVDPARDTPAVLKDYVSMFHPRIVGIAPSPEELTRMAAAWRVKYARVPSRDGTDYAMDHTAAIFLVDPDGRILRRLAHDQSGAATADRIRAAMLSR